MNNPESFAPQDVQTPRPAVDPRPRLYFKPYANSPAGWMGAITNGKSGSVVYWVSAEDGECIPNAEIPGIPPDLSAEPSTYPLPTRREALAAGRASVAEALRAAEAAASDKRVSPASDKRPGPPPVAIGGEETSRREPPPSVGRIVHYQSFGTPGGEYSSLARVAIVTQVAMLGDCVDLCIINPTGIFFTAGVQYSPTPQAGCWSWPPRA